MDITLELETDIEDEWYDSVLSLEWEDEIWPEDCHIDIKMAGNTTMIGDMLNSLIRRAEEGLQLIKLRRK